MALRGLYPLDLSCFQNQSNIISFITCMHRFLLPNSGTFIVITIRIASNLYSVVSFCSDSYFAVVVFFNSIISVFCLQPPVQPIHSSATATCVLTTPWCVMGFRTVSTHGMKTTARVNPFLSHLTAYRHYA